MKGLFLFTAFFVLFACQPKEAKRINVECPSEKRIIEVLRNYSKDVEIKVESVKQFDNTGLCEVFFRFGVQPAVTYVDPDLKYMFPATIDAKTGENLALKKIRENAKIPEDILKKFEKHVNFEVGKGKRYVYFITEPNNNDAEESYKILEKFAKEKEIKVKIIIRPEKINHQAYEIALSSLCDKKGFEDMLKGYNSKRSCEEGRKVLDENMKFIEERMNIPHKNPIVITSDGKLFSGKLTEDILERLLK